MYVGVLNLLIDGGMSSRVNAVHSWRAEVSGCSRRESADHSSFLSPALN